jgi:hypothetical protein
MSEYLNVAGAAELTGLATSTLNKLRLSGDGPEYIKLGRRVLYARYSIEVGCAQSGERPHRTPSRSRLSASWPTNPLT